MKWLFFIALLFCLNKVHAKADSTYYDGSNKFIRYTGRGDFSNNKAPRFWASAAYVEINFSGSYCILLINDEVLYNSVHNYIEIKIDERKAQRIQLKEKNNRIILAEGLSTGKHTAIICKDTEAENGYIEIAGFVCKTLLKLTPQNKRKIEFIGDSITCGFGSDESSIPCDTGQWYDEHNAWLAYGPITARKCKAQWHLTSVSGIGLIHSCCNKKILMPQVFNKISLSKDTISWNFNLYQPDVVTVCLGQNDGIQDSSVFCNAYVQFAKRLRSHYPKARLVFLTSPMAGPQLNAALIKYTIAVKQYFINNGDNNVGSYAFSKQFIKGCGNHPALQEQQEMADELSLYIKKIMKW